MIHMLEQLLHHQGRAVGVFRKEVVVRAVRRHVQQRNVVRDLPVEIDRRVPRVERVDGLDDVRLEEIRVCAGRTALEQRARRAQAVVDVVRVVRVRAPRDEAAVVRNVDSGLESAVAVVVEKGRDCAAEVGSRIERRVVRASVDANGGVTGPLGESHGKFDPGVILGGHEYARLRLRIVVDDAGRDVDRERVTGVPAQAQAARRVGLTAFGAKLAAEGLRIVRQSAGRARARQPVLARIVEASSRSHRSISRCRRRA